MFFSVRSDEEDIEYTWHFEYIPASLNFGRPKLVSGRVLCCQEIVVSLMIIQILECGLLLVGHGFTT